MASHDPESADEVVYPWAIDTIRRLRLFHEVTLLLLLEDLSAPRFCGEIDLAFGADRATVGDLNGQL